MKKALLGSCLTIAALICTQSNALTLISEIVKNPAVLQANPQLNDPEVMAVQKQFAQCWEAMYDQLFGAFGDDTVLELENILEKKMEKHQWAVLTGAPTNETFDDLVDAFEQLGLYLLDERKSTPEITALYCKVLLIITSTVATMNFSVNPSVNLQEMDGQAQQNMEAAGMKLYKRLQVLFIETFGFTPQEVQA